jgi:hypothetical protein
MMNNINRSAITAVALVVSMAHPAIAADGIYLGRDSNGNTINLIGVENDDRVCGANSEIQSKLNGKCRDFAAVLYRRGQGDVRAISRWAVFNCKTQQLDGIFYLYGGEYRPIGEAPTSKAFKVMMDVGCTSMYAGRE